MLETIQKEWQAKIILLIFAAYVAVWLSLQFPQTRNSLLLDLYGQTYGIVALFGGIWGLFIAKPWGFLKSAMGKAIVFLSLGLLAQVFGQVAYTVYIYVLHVSIPYPSVGDVGYFGSIPLYIIGTIYLAKVSGVRVSMRSVVSKIQAIIIPILILGAAYLLFLQNYEFDWSLPLTMFLDFGYPLGQAIYISIALLTYLLSRNLLGGVMKTKILFILFALFMQFLSDYVFLFQVSRGTWELGGISEFIYLVAYLLMAIGILQLKTMVKKLQE
ncbi:MAG: hypothetical protein KBD51_01390 [Candidatus Levybacteria bacterium]|nr:hypothetical protein [Candidatus Levybacteria bacterium]